MRSRWSSTIFLAAQLAVAATSSFARAECHDPPRAAPAPDPIEAERLFVEAKQLLKDGRTADACAKLARSQALDPAGGTLLELAYCLELLGKLATSYARFEEALAVAKRDENERRAELAQEHMAALAPRLMKIEIRVSASARARPDLEVRRDGACVDPTAWERAVAVDPGKHVITATAPGATPWELGVELVQEGSTTAVEIPALQSTAPIAASQPVSTTSAQPPPELAESTTGSWVPGIVVLGVGVAVLGASAAVGQTALTMGSQVVQTCRDGLCPPSQKAKADQADALAMASTIGFTTGAVMAAVGAVLLVVRPFGKTPTLRLKAGPGSVSMVGTF